MILSQSLGWILVFLAFAHLVFPRYFKWKEELSGLSIINREIMQVHTFFIAFVVFLMGLLLITSSDLLVSTTLGRRVSAGLAVFWGIRLVCQFFWYSLENWKGKRFETLVHVCFSLLWLFLTALFSAMAFGWRQSLLLK